MIWQLRTYTIKPGCMTEFRALWRDHIVPLREAVGFTVAGGWYDEDDLLFVWAVGHEAPDGWDALEATYYADPRRGELPHDPNEFVAKIDKRLLRQA